MYVLPEALTFRNVKTIRDELLHYLEHRLKENEEGEKEATLDFFHLQDLDTAGLQLLLSAVRSFQNNDCLLKIVNMQALIKELLQLTGAGDIITTD